MSICLTSFEIPLRPGTRLAMRAGTLLREDELISLLARLEIPLKGGRLTLITLPLAAVLSVSVRPCRMNHKDTMATLRE